MDAPALNVEIKRPFFETVDEKVNTNSFIGFISIIEMKISEKRMSLYES